MFVIFQISWFKYSVVLNKTVLENSLLKNRGG